jgi:hypothetical protein
MFLDDDTPAAQLLGGLSTGTLHIWSPAEGVARLPAVADAEFQRHSRSSTPRVKARKTSAQGKGDRIMNTFRKSLISLGAVAGVALVVSLAAPRTVHALGAALTRITNTATDPAIVEDVPHLASHTEVLTAYISDPAVDSYLTQWEPNGTKGEEVFTVPAGQNFVVTSVEIWPNVSAPTWVNLINTNAITYYGGWEAPGTVTTEYQYPSGMAVASGVTLVVSAGQPCLVTVHGYLTPQ